MLMPRTKTKEKLGERGTRVLDGYDVSLAERAVVQRAIDSRLFPWLQHPNLQLKVFPTFCSQA
jgi:hypothetical protein